MLILFTCHWSQILGSLATRFPRDKRLQIWVRREKINMDFLLKTTCYPSQPCIRQIQVNTQGGRRFSKNITSLEAQVGILKTEQFHTGSLINWLAIRFKAKLSIKTQLNHTAGKSVSKPTVISLEKTQSVWSRSDNCTFWKIKKDNKRICNAA